MCVYIYISMQYVYVHVYVSPPVDGWGWGVAGLHRPHGRDLAWKAITSVCSEKHGQLEHYGIRIMESESPGTFDTRNFRFFWARE